LRFVHVSDLHIGKQLYGYSLIDDQRAVLQQIVDIARSENAVGLLIAGDVYDRTVPSEEAVVLCDRFLVAAAQVCPVYLIAGNHDSAERLAFCRDLIRGERVFISGADHARAERIVLQDADGPLNLYLLPFFKTSQVRTKYGDPHIDTPDKALQRVLQESGVDPGARNVLVAHQFVTAAGVELQTADSEEFRPEVGGADCLSADLLKDFDYVALGHLHRPQNVGRPEVRYCGSPLVYSESEADDRKSVTVVDLGPKGTAPEIRAVPLVPARPLRVIRGKLEDLLAAAGSADVSADDYIAATVFGSPVDARKRLQAVYSHLLNVKYEEERALDADADPAGRLAELRQQSPAAIFADFYRKMNGTELTGRQQQEFAAAEERAREAAREAEGR